MEKSARPIDFNPIFKAFPLACLAQKFLELFTVACFVDEIIISCSLFIQHRVLSWTINQSRSKYLQKGSIYSLVFFFSVNRKHDKNNALKDLYEWKINKQITYTIYSKFGIIFYLINYVLYSSLLFMRTESLMTLCNTFTSKTDFAQSLMIYRMHQLLFLISWTVCSFFLQDIEKDFTILQRKLHYIHISNDRCESADVRDEYFTSHFHFRLLICNFRLHLIHVQ